MISIKKLLEQRRDVQADKEVLEASLQTSRLLIEAITTHVVHGRDPDLKVFMRTLRGLLRKMDHQPSAIQLLEISSDAAEAMETYAGRTTEYIREQNQQRQSMVAMLTETLADVSGQSDVSVARLQAIEQQIERASELEDMRALSIGLQTCLAALREAAVQQKKASATSVQRLREQIDVAQKGLVSEALTSHSSFDEVDLESEVSDDALEEASRSYVAAFKLQRADHIALKFGDQAKHQMLALLGQSLRTVLGPKDRLLRWKGTSFVMFLESAATIHEIRARLAEAVAATGQHYIEVGKKSALLSVGVDWLVFPQAQCLTLDAVFTEVDSFLAGKTANHGGRGKKKHEAVRYVANPLSGAGARLMKALVVDDDLTTRIVLQEVLSPYAEVHICVDGVEAVKACTHALNRGRPYDLICLDLNMPIMDGLEALKLIRQDEERHGRIRPRASKVVITTAADDQNSIRGAFRELCDAYLVKPIDGAELLDLVYCLCPLEEGTP